MIAPHPAGLAGGATERAEVKDEARALRVREELPSSASDDAEDDKEALEHEATAEHFSELAAIGFALAKSAALLP